jgi:hypothetical protein
MAPSTNASALTNGNAAARPTVLATAPPKLVERRGVATNVVPRGATLDNLVAGVAATAVAVDLAAGVAGKALEGAGVRAGREKERLRRTIAAGSAGSAIMGGAGVGSAILGGAGVGDAGSASLGGAGVEGDAEGC